MTEATLFSLCLALADHHTQSFHSRKGAEWRVNLACWTLLVAATAFVAQFCLPQTVLRFLPWGCVAFVVVFAIYWTRAMWVANANDKLMIAFYFAQAHKALEKPGTALEKPPAKISGLKWLLGFLFDWSQFFQLLVTGLLAAGLWFVASQQFCIAIEQAHGTATP